MFCLLLRPYVLIFPPDIQIDIIQLSGYNHDIK